MRTRNWIVAVSLFVLVAAAAVVGQSAMATADPQVELELRALSPVFPAGGIADLEVIVGPEALGGYAKLYATIDGETNQVQTFPINEPCFVLQAQVPSDPEYFGQILSFQYEAFSCDGRYLGESKKPAGIVEPDFE